MWLIIIVVDSRRVFHPDRGCLGAKHVSNRGFWHHFTKGEGSYLLVTSLHGGQAGPETVDLGLVLRVVDIAPVLAPARTVAARQAWVLPVRRFGPTVQEANAPHVQNLLPMRWQRVKHVQLGFRHLLRGLARVVPLRFLELVVQVQRLAIVLDLFPPIGQRRFVGFPHGARPCRCSGARARSRTTCGAWLLARSPPGVPLVGATLSVLTTFPILYAIFIRNHRIMTGNVVEGTPLPACGGRANRRTCWLCRSSSYSPL